MQFIVTVFGENVKVSALNFHEIFQCGHLANSVIQMSDIDKSTYPTV